MLWLKRIMLALGLVALLSPVAPSALAETQPRTSKPQTRTPEQTKALVADLQRRWKRRAALEKQGKRTEAMALAEETYQLSRKVFGAKTIYTAYSARQVGNLLMQARNPAKAANYFLAELIGVSATSSVDTEMYQATARRLSDAYKAARRFGDAEALYRHILKGTAGRDAQKSQVADAYFRRQLGRVLRRRGQPAKAEGEYRTALAIYDRHLKENDFRRGLLLTDLAGVLRVQGRFEDAIGAYERVVRIIRAVRGDDDVNLGIVLDNLGNVFQEMSRLSDAEKVQRQAVEIFEAKLGDAHLTTALGRANLAVVFDKQARYGEAEPLYRKALEVYEARLAESDPRIGVLLDNYAGLKRRTGDIKAARVLYDRSLASLTKAYPETHPEVSKVLNNLALAEQRVGNLPRAEKLLLRALAITETTFGANHYRTGVVLGNIGDVRIAAKNYRGARKALLKAVRVIEQTVGDGHEHLIPPLRLLAGMSLGLREYGRALDYSRRAMAAETTRLKRLRLDPEGPVLTGGGDSAFSGALYVFNRVREQRPDLAEALSREAFEIAQRASASAAALSVAQIGARLASGNEGLSDLVRRRQDVAKSWKAVNGRLIAAVTKQDGDRDREAEARLRSQRDAFVADLAKLDDDLATRFPDFANL
ncbi:MAG: tetratricopeptide repeat protein, partial [Pseudomonadota bacterium]